MAKCNRCDKSLGLFVKRKHAFGNAYCVECYDSEREELAGLKRNRVKIEDLKERSKKPPISRIVKRGMVKKGTVGACIGAIVGGPVGAGIGGLGGVLLDAFSNDADNRPDSKRRHFSRDELARIFSRSRGECDICGARKNLAIDHIVPLCKGGSNDLNNLRALCRTCNSRKGGR